MACRAYAVVLLLVVAVACSPPAPEPTPTPTVSVRDVYTPGVARLVPQEVFNCIMDREAERISRLSARQIVQQELAVERGTFMERWGIALHVQGLSCWAVHASDAQYADLMRYQGDPVVVLPSVQLCIEDAMSLDGIAATAASVRFDGDLSVYSDQALQCFPSR